MIIAINGGIGEGKDTFTELFIKHNPTFINKKFATKLKQIAAILVGCKVEDFEDNDFKNSLMPLPWRHPKTGERITYRFFLQYVGTELFRDNFDPNFWINALLSEYDETQDWIISDFRFLSEAKGVKNFGGITINIRRGMFIGDWIKSEYFYQVVDVNKLDKLNIDISNIDISQFYFKNKFVDFLKENNLFIDNKYWQQLIHVSERELYESNYGFDFIINNDSDLTTLENRIKFLSERI